MGLGLRDKRALVTARLLVAVKSIFDQSGSLAPAQPDPVPSVVRTVVVKSTDVEGWKAKSPALLPTALDPLCAMRMPAALRSPPFFATSIIVLAARARASAVTVAVASNQPRTS